MSVTDAPLPSGWATRLRAGNRFAGQVRLSNNLAVTFGAETVSQNTTIDSNGPGNSVVKANGVPGTPGCSGNTPPPTNAGQGDA